MRLSGWFIEGFGVFHDAEVSGLGEGLTVFLGPNEAGKSTSLAFLRGVLFGYRARRAKEGQYTPLRGGRHGGRVTIESAEGTLVVERLALPRSGLQVHYADGREASEEHLRRALGGADEKLFRSVFAFDLAEMQSFEWLKGDEIRDRIFSAGIAGAGKSARQVMTRIDGEMSVLLRQRGAARLNALAASLEDLTKKLKLARQESVRYPALLQDEAEWKQTVIALGSDGEALRHSLARLELLIELWPVWAAREAARREMESFNPIDEFPVDPELRLATLAEQIHATQTSVDRFEADRSGKLQWRAQLIEILDASLDSRRKGVEEHHSLLALHRDRLQQVPPARFKRDQVELELWKKLRQLGPDWDEARLEELNLSIPRSEEVRHWQRKLDGAERSVAEARHSWEVAAHDLEKPGAGEPDAGPAAQDAEKPSLEAREQALRRLRLRAADIRVQESRTEALERLLDDRKVTMSGFHSQASTGVWVALADASGRVAVDAGTDHARNAQAPLGHAHSAARGRRGQVGRQHRRGTSRGR